MNGGGFIGAVIWNMIVKKVYDKINLFRITKKELVKKLIEELIL